MAKKTLDLIEADLSLRARSWLNGVGIYPSDEAMRRLRILVRPLATELARHIDETGRKPIIP